MVPENGFDVLGIGNAIVDIFTHEDDEFLALHGMPKDSMTLIDAERSAFLYGSMRPIAKMSGGSVANTIVCAAGLGSAASFVGKVAVDEFGTAFTDCATRRSHRARCRISPQQSRASSSSVVATAGSTARVPRPWPNTRTTTTWPG